MRGKNNLGSFCITPMSGVKLDTGGDFFTIELRLLMKIGWFEHVFFYAKSNKSQIELQLKFKKMEGEYAYFGAEDVFLENNPIYYIHFSFLASGKYMVFKKFDYYGDTNIAPEEKFKMSVGFHVPDWAKGAIMYHIFIDRFFRDFTIPMPIIRDRKVHEHWDERPIIGPDENGNWCMDFYGGNLLGIVRCLKYIKSLGVTILYLSPIVEARSNHRYDTGNYEKVDSYAGSIENLKLLCSYAHSLGMKVILDGVFNHVGRDSKYFNEFGNYHEVGAIQSVNSPYRSFFFFDENGEVSYWWGDPNLPQTNGYSIDWRNYIFGGEKNGIVGKWFSYGIDGLRLDVPDNLLDDFIEGIVASAYRSHPSPFILGEVWENAMRKDNRTYISSGRAMHSVMNYFLIGSLVRYFKYADYNALIGTSRELIADYPQESLLTLMNPTSTHDISRIIEIYGNEYFLIDDDGNINLGSIQGSREQVEEKIIFNKNKQWPWHLYDESPKAIQSHTFSNLKRKFGKKIMLPHIVYIAFWAGIFSIFYGDEVGASGLGNLDTRGPYPWSRRDKKLLKFFRKIGRVINENQFLKYADITLPRVTKYFASYERVGEESSILVVVSRSRNRRYIEIPDKYLRGDVILKVGDSNFVSLAPYGAIVVKINNT